MIFPLVISVTLAIITYILFIIFFLSYRKTKFFDYETNLQDEMNILLTELIDSNEEYREQIEKRLKKIEKKLKELEGKIKR